MHIFQHGQTLVSRSHVFQIISASFKEFPYVEYTNFMIMAYQTWLWIY